MNTTYNKAILELFPISPDSLIDRTKYFNNLYDNILKFCLHMNEKLDIEDAIWTHISKRIQICKNEFANSYTVIYKLKEEDILILDLNININQITFQFGNSNTNFTYHRDINLIDVYTANHICYKQYYTDSHIIKKYKYEYVRMIQYKNYYMKIESYHQPIFKCNIIVIENKKRYNVVVRTSESHSYIVVSPHDRSNKIRITVRKPCNSFTKVHIDNETTSQEICLPEGLSQFHKLQDDEALKVAYSILINTHNLLFNIATDVIYQEVFANADPDFNPDAIYKYI